MERQNFKYGNQLESKLELPLFTSITVFPTYVHVINYLFYLFEPSAPSFSYQNLFLLLKSWRRCDFVLPDIFTSGQEGNFFLQSKYGRSNCFHCTEFCLGASSSLPNIDLCHKIIKPHSITWKSSIFCKHNQKSNSGSMC